MLKPLLAAFAFCCAAPAAAAEPWLDEDEDIVRALPPAEEVEAMAPALDAMLGAFLDLDVGPVLDAADPYARRPGYGRRGRTLRELGRRDDPWFDERLRESLYGATADTARTIEALRHMAPALRRSMFEMERSIAAAMEEYRARRYAD